VQNSELFPVVLVTQYLKKLSASLQNASIRYFPTNPKISLEAQDIIGVTN